jgi:hypothetical protein
VRTHLAELIARGAVALVETVVKLVRRDPPKRVEDVYPEGITRAERARREEQARRDEGMSVVYRSEPPPGGSRRANEAPSFGAREDRCEQRCEHGSRCTLPAGHTPSFYHETEHGCVTVSPRARGEAPS